MYIFIFIVLFLIIIYKYFKKIQIYKNTISKENINVLLIGGTHGNEPAGSYALMTFKETINKFKNLNITIIPKANKCGLKINTRYLPHRLFNRDLNRNYKESNYLTPSIEQNIYNEVIKNDIIIDLHEGYDFYKLNKRSIGSTIFNNDKRLRDICIEITQDLNNNINDEYRKFTYLQEIVHNNNSMHLLCNKLNKTYILVETSGQNNIQPLHTRVNQQLFIINKIMNYLS